MLAKIDNQSWNREKRRLDALFNEIHHQATREAKEASDEYVDLVKSGIGKTTSPWFASYWKPLSEYWKSIKKANKEKFWLETGGIYRAVKTNILVNTTKIIKIFGGIRKMTDPDAFERAERNEYGLGLGPARPLFEPAKDTFSQMTSGGRKLKSDSRFRKILLTAIKKVYH